MVLPETADCKPLSGFFPERGIHTRHRAVQEAGNPLPDQWQIPAKSLTSGQEIRMIRSLSGALAGRPDP
jgi:hypothetical protein